MKMGGDNEKNFYRKDSNTRNTFRCCNSSCFLVDRIFDYHISGTLFFTGLFCICFSIIIYTIKSDTDSGFPGILCTSFYMIFFYLSVYYRFIPAWTMKTVWGIILFILLNFGFATASFIAYYIVNFAEEIFKSNDGILIIVILEKIFGIILIIATVLLLYTLAKFFTFVRI